MSLTFQPAGGEDLMSPTLKKSSKDSPAAAPAQPTGRAASSRPSTWRLPNPLTTVEPLLKRDEADILFVAGNVALVAFEIIEWPVAALMLVLHAMGRSRFKVLHVIAEVAEEAE